RPLADLVEIEDISFRKAKNGTDTVLVRSNRFFEPTIFALEGKKPRLVIDIKNASYVRKNLPMMDIDGKMIKRIRSQFDDDFHILRIVLDLESSKGFMAKQSFHKDENLYSLEVIGEDWSEGNVTRNKDERAEAIIQKSYVERKESDSRKRAERRQTARSKTDNMTPWSLNHKIKERKRNQFRREGTDLNEKDVKVMLSQYDFYSTCMGYNIGFCNQDGDFNNDFNDNNNGTITDKSTRLMWQKSGSLEGVDWEGARRYVNELNHQHFAGYSDWRLPTLEELASLMEGVWKNGDLFIEAVFDMQQKSCWSMDTHGSHKAWKANFHLGYIIDSSFTSKNSVRAVRSIHTSQSIIGQEKNLYQYQTSELPEKR
ncbi:MAG: DUF1566 domain-containing protein, partial [Thermodesulfobacteriota bacterium]|nr:DUF1566 domain-containing protein [Thermodesulfobacteriota bacterium]